MAQLDIDDPLYEAIVPKRHREPFVQLSHRALVSGLTVLRGAKQLAVWIHIHYLMWLEKSNTVRIGNKTLASWDVDRRTKYSTLRLLEEAGMVKLGTRRGRSITVTVTDPK